MALKDRPDPTPDDDDVRHYEVIMPSTQGIDLPMHWELSVENLRRTLNTIIPTAESSGEVVDYASLFTPEDLNARLDQIKALLMEVYITMMKREVVWRALAKRHFYDL